MKKFLTLVLTILTVQIFGQTTIVSAFGYDSCVQIISGNHKVIIDPNVGGRVMEYSIDGSNVIYEDTSQNGWMPTPDNPEPDGHLSGARFDVGPLVLRNSDRDFWYGKWSFDITGEYVVRLRSKVDPGNNIQIERDFTLDPKTGNLYFEQRIFNRANKPQRFAYWSRTFYKGGGVAVLPLNPKSKYPGQLAVYEPGNERTLHFNYDLSKEPTLEKRNGYLFFTGPFTYQKIDLDMADGWAGYLVDDLYFTKTFPVYDDKVYADVTGANFSIWYNKDQMVEIEPVGPWEWIAPDSAIAFTETWSLEKYSQLKKGESVSFGPLDFHTRNVSEFAPAYYHKGKKAMAVNSVKFPDQWSAAEMVFPLGSGVYDLTFTSLLETDGESSYRIFVDDKLVGEFQNIETDKDYVPYEQTWKKIDVEKGTVLRVEFISHSNGKVPEGNGFAYSRGRWTGLTFERRN